MTNLATPQPLPQATRTCARCGSGFSAFGREYTCYACRKPKPRTSRPESHSLTFREQQIVALIQQAKANKEIAWELKLTEGTVKEYLHHIFHKLHVSNRTQLALRTLQQPCTA